MRSDKRRHIESRTSGVASKSSDRCDHRRSFALGVLVLLAKSRQLPEAGPAPKHPRGHHRAASAACTLTQPWRHGLGRRRQHAEPRLEARGRDEAAWVNADDAEERGRFGGGERRARHVRTAHGAQQRLCAHLAREAAEELKGGAGLTGGDVDELLHPVRGLRPTRVARVARSRRCRIGQAEDAALERRAENRLEERHQRAWLFAAPHSTGQFPEASARDQHKAALNRRRAKSCQPRRATGATAGGFPGNGGNTSASASAIIRPAASRSAIAVGDRFLPTRLAEHAQRRSRVAQIVGRPIALCLRPLADFWRAASATRRLLRRRLYGFDASRRRLESAVEAPRLHQRLGCVAQRGELLVQRELVGKRKRRRRAGWRLRAQLPRAVDSGAELGVHVGRVGARERARDVLRQDRQGVLVPREEERLRGARAPQLSEGRDHVVGAAFEGSAAAATKEDVAPEERRGRAAHEEGGRAGGVAGGGERNHAQRADAHLVAIAEGVRAARDRVHLATVHAQRAAKHFAQRHVARGVVPVLVRRQDCDWPQRCPAVVVARQVRQSR
mmetsp:Transcript_33989/g.113392  ORF Transcript_33989/g.113392 Transcript_33989/m.113392 type:complete len:558 (-) Transcript_33989:235-1908(-)